MISSRTPEGDPNRCAICRNRFRLFPSSPGNDAPCPYCGTLAWFPTGPSSREAGESASTGRANPRRANAGSSAQAAGREPAPPGEFTLDDFRKQFEAIAKMGMKDMISRMPGMSDLIPEGEDVAVVLRRVRGMIDSMTMVERADLGIIDRPRRRRIAAGAGVRHHEVEQFLRQFVQVKSLMRPMATMSLWQRIKMVVGIGKAY
jgi:hypothetical protein